MLFRSSSSTLPFLNGVASAVNDPLNMAFPHRSSGDFWLSYPQNGDGLDACGLWPSSARPVQPCSRRIRAVVLHPPAVALNRGARAARLRHGQSPRDRTLRTTSDYAFVPRAARTLLPGPGCRGAVRIERLKIETAEGQGGGGLARSVRGGEVRGGGPSWRTVLQRGSGNRGARCSLG